MGVLFRRVKVREHERGLLFKDREFKAVLRPGRRFVWDPLRRVRLDVMSVRDVWLVHKDLDVIARSGALGDEARVVDLKDHERAVVWVNGRVEAVLKPGLYALWTAYFTYDNLRDDPHEEKNLAADQPDRVAALKQRIGSWWTPGG